MLICAQQIISKQSFFVNKKSYKKVNIRFSWSWLPRLRDTSIGAPLSQQQCSCMVESQFLLSNNRPISINIPMIALISIVSLPMTFSLSSVSLLSAVFWVANTPYPACVMTAEAGSTKEWLKTGFRYKVHYLENDMK